MAQSCAQIQSRPSRSHSGNLLPIMVKAIQELKTENEALRATITEQVKIQVEKALADRGKKETESKKVTLNDTKD